MKMRKSGGCLSGVVVQGADEDEKKRGLLVWGCLRQKRR